MKAKVILGGDLVPFLLLCASFDWFFLFREWKEGTELNLPEVLLSPLEGLVTSRHCPFLNSEFSFVIKSTVVASYYTAIS
jgi:hypothetical protein